MIGSARFASRQEQLEAQDRLRRYAALNRSSKEKVNILDRATLAQIGQRICLNSYANTTSDEVARDNWVEHIESLRFRDPARFFVLAQQQLLMDMVIINMGTARWFAEGLPVYRLGHKQTASFMATTVSDDMIPDVNPPFAAFYIELPERLVEISHSDGKFYPATGVIVQRIDVTSDYKDDAGETRLPVGKYWRWACATRSPTILWEMNRDTAHLVAGTRLPEDDYYGIGMELDDHDNRVRRLIQRLIVSLCLDLASGKELKRKTEPWSREGKKAKGGPSFNVFLDPTEVEFDARPYVRAFLGGNRKSPDYCQTVVGHWKQQPYGPRHSLRKLIRIMPYERLDHLPERPVAAAL